MRQSSKTSAADLLWGQSLNDEADLYAILGNNAQSLAVAKQAKDVAQSLMQSRSGAQEGMQLLFDASIRAGNALWALPGRRQEAVQEYDDAVRIATTIASSSGERGDIDVVDAHLKIGDVYKDGDSKQHQQALGEYQIGLKTCEAALAKRPDDFDLLRNKGKAFYRIAEFLRGDNALADARAYYQKAFEVQSGLVSRNAQEAVAAQKTPDSSLKSNLAATYAHWGLLEQGAGNLDLALEKLRQGVVLDEELTKNEPGNPQWQEYLTPNYLYLAQTLEGLKRPDEALTYYRKLNELEENARLSRARTAKSAKGIGRGRKAARRSLHRPCPDRSVSRGRAKLEPVGRGPAKR